MVRDTGEGYFNDEDVVDALSEAGFRYDADYNILMVPNITNITYGRDVGYVMEQERFDADIESISATEIRDAL